MRIHSANFLASAVRLDQYPTTGLPEVAFSGKSNVGKSSLINSLTGRGGLVKISKTPGKTRLLNFFSINDKMVFVDMPGYGFANVPFAIKRSWGEMVETYLRSRLELRAIIQLLDIRRTPNDDDKSMLEWVRAEDVPLVLVFTKVDKLSKAKRMRMARESMKNIGDYVARDTRWVFYSSHTGEGKKELMKIIAELAERRRRD